MNPLPSETESKLAAYRALLEKWQKKINLVSSDTIADMDQRHFQDSLQLLKFLKPTDKVLIDLGSGAGFPGLVLAMARPDLQVHLIESDEKKCIFMQTVSRETNTIVNIHNRRIEDMAGKGGEGGLPAHVDVITARALAPLPDLLAYAAPLVAQNRDIQLIFLKGRTARNEIESARSAGWAFDIQETPSETDARGRVLMVSKIRK